MIVAHACTTAPMTAASPTGPPPKIAMLDPAGQASERITPPAPVWNPQPNGPSNSSGTSSASIFTRLRSCVTAWAAKEDWPKKLAETGTPSMLIAVLPSPRAPA
ncbi:hypothetical protein NRB_20100 [Novosphingobium sp. 11B]